MKINLSICIPTFNRSEFLIKGLEFWSKVPLSNKLEFVVLDDGSTDDTKLKIDKFMRNNSQLNINYFRNTKHLGFDHMILSLVKHAKGEFCWLISDDDLPRKDSIQKLFEVTKKYPKLSLIHLNYSRYDNLLKKVTSEKMVGDILKDIYFDNADKFFFRRINKSYFNYLGTNVITMSTDIVNRKLWLEAQKDMDKFIGHNFMHCFVIAKMIAKYPSIYYVSTPIVEYLSNNHRVWPNDIWKDYNNVMLPYLKDLGFSEANVTEMQNAQRKFEKREEVLKNPLLKLIYKLTRPLHSKIDFILSKINI